MSNSPRRMFFDTAKIFNNYMKVQSNFDRINQEVGCRRDAFDDGVIHNLMQVYGYLNRQTKNAQEKTEGLCDPGIFLEINTIVNLGTDKSNRQNYYGFISHTQHKFSTYFPMLKQWCKRHERKNDDPYKIAAGLYVRILAAPQLFSDGNHRSGALIANHYLLKKGELPFVLTPDNAVTFFNLASHVKFKQEDIRSKFKRAVGWRDEVAMMRAFLKESSREFITDEYPVWLPTPPDSYSVTPSVSRLSM